MGHGAMGHRSKDNFGGLYFESRGDNTMAKNELQELLQKRGLKLPEYKVEASTLPLLCVQCEGGVDERAGAGGARGGQ